MEDFNAIKEKYNQNKVIASKVEDFIIDYVIVKENIEKRIKILTKSYFHTLLKLPTEWRNASIIQFVAHYIFNKNGVLEKILKQSTFKKLNKNELNYLEFQLKHPWQFSFSEITGRPYKDFFKMKDVFTHKEYLIYSPAMSKISEEVSASLWFSLNSFNGSCWQTYGPINYFKGFQRDDIVFFASKLNPNKWFENATDIMEEVDRNPFPFFALINGSNYPQTFNKNDQIVLITAEYEIDDTFEQSVFKNDFKIEYSNEVYKLTLKKWGEAPHFAVAYFDEKENLLQLTAMTGRGFDKLTDKFIQLGYDISMDHDFRVNPSMLTTAEAILKKKLSPFIYERFFKVNPKPGEKESIDRINNMLKMILPDINSGREPDIESAAKKAGLDINEAKEILKAINKKFK